jgi:hypothetical protein
MVSNVNTTALANGRTRLNDDARTRTFLSHRSAWQQ